MFTNQTQNLGLPQWEDNDTPSWGVDVNNAFEKIDESYGTLKTADETSQTQIEALTQTQTTQANQITDLQESSGNNTAQLAQIQAQVNVNTAHLADVDANIKATDKTVADNKTAVDQEIETINNTVDDLSETVATLENEHNAQQADINQLKTTTQTNSQNIQTIQTENVTRDSNISKNASDIGELQQEQQELSGEVAGFSTDIMQNTSDITAIKSKNTQQDNKIGDLETKTTALENLINIVGNNASDALQTANQVMAFFPLHFSTSSIDTSKINWSTGGNSFILTVNNMLRRLFIFELSGALSVTNAPISSRVLLNVYETTAGVCLMQNSILKTGTTGSVLLSDLKILVFPNSNVFNIKIQVINIDTGDIIPVTGTVNINVVSANSFEILTEKATLVR